jgi:hypothetical protein
VALEGAVVLADGPTVDEAVTVHVAAVAAALEPTSVRVGAHARLARFAERVVLAPEHEEGDDGDGEDR